MELRKNTPARAFLRSVIHATDSAHTGCRPNKAAPSQAPLTFSRFRISQRRIVLKLWRRMFSR